MNGRKASRRYPSPVPRQPNLKLAELRINAGLGYWDLAYRAGCSPKTIRLVERGHVPSPRLQFQIAGVFGMRPLDLWPIGQQKVVA